MAFAGRVPCFCRRAGLQSAARVSMGSRRAGRAVSCFQCVREPQFSIGSMGWKGRVRVCFVSQPAFRRNACFLLYFLPVTNQDGLRTVSYTRRSVFVCFRSADKFSSVFKSTEQ